MLFYIAPRCIHPVTQVILASEVLYDPSEAQEVANAAVQLLQDEARFKSCFLSKANLFEDFEGSSSHRFCNSWHFCCNWI